jgi:hypothetical protein
MGAGVTVEPVADVERGQLRIAVIGLAGSGKSTFAGVVAELAHERGLRCARLGLAAPLYALQERVYEAARTPLREGAQDQVLMETLARALRRISPTSLVDHFLDRLGAVEADVVVNDDLRDPHVDAVRLAAQGFRVVRVRATEPVRAARLSGRGDLTRSDRSTDELDRIVPDAVIDNDGDLDAFRAAVRALVGSWL